MLPVFLVAVGDGDSADFTYLPLAIQSRVKGTDSSFLPQVLRTLFHILCYHVCFFFC